MTDNNNNNKKYLIIIGMLIVIGALVLWLKYTVDHTSTQNIIAQVENNTVEINVTQHKVNQTLSLVNETNARVNDSITNQFKIAKGLNTLGNVVIGKINNISEKTKLIDDIKFDTEQILNKAGTGNITLSP